MRFRMCLILALSVLAGCVSKPQQEKTYTFSYPLEVGNTWKYESVWTLDDTAIDSHYVYSSIATKYTTLTVFPVFEFRDSAQGAVSYDYYEQEPDGVFLYASTPGGIHALWKSLLQPGVNLRDPPVLLVPTSFQIGEEWTYDTLVDSASNIRKPLTRQFLGMEPVGTLLGTFQCYKFQTVGYGNEKRYHYYYPNVGLIMNEEIIDSMGIASFDSSGSISERYVKSVRRNKLVSMNY